MRGRRVLVTGANGFVGRHLTGALHARGDLVTGMGLGDVDESSRQGLLDAWVSCDVTDLHSLRSNVGSARPDFIVHLAGQASAAKSFEDPVGTFHVNAVGTSNLLEAVRHEALGARVLVVGTSESYGPQPEGTRVTENAPFRPISPYGLSKAAADAVAEFYARAHGLDVIRTRSFHHVGPRQASRFAIPGFALQIAAIEAGEAEAVLKVGNLEVTRDVTDVRDVVEAYLLLLERGHSGSAYNVCRGEGVSLTWIVRHLCSRARVPVRIEIDPARMRPADVPYLVGDPSAIHAATAWRPARSVESTLDEILEDSRRSAMARTSGGGATPGFGVTNV